MANRVKVRDRGYNKRLRQLGKNIPKLTVGIHAAKGQEAKEQSPGIDLITVATAHEFGTDTIPQRSFIRGWVDENKSVIKSTIKRGERAVANGRVTQKVALNRIGLWAVGQIQTRIARGIPPELAEETKRRKEVNGKSGDTPLIDTGQLRSAITFEVGPNAGN